MPQIIPTQILQIIQAEVPTLEATPPPAVVLVATPEVATPAAALEVIPAAVVPAATPEAETQVEAVHRAVPEEEAVQNSL